MIAKGRAVLLLALGLSLSGAACTRASDEGRYAQAATYVVRAPGDSGLADGKTPAPLEAILATEAGTPLSGVEVVLACDDANATLRQPGRTDAAGTATGALLTAVPGRYRIRATARYSTLSVPFPDDVELYMRAPDQPTRPSLALAAAPSVAAADGQRRVVLRVQATPAAGGQVADFAGQTVLLHSALPADPNLDAGVLDANGTYAAAFGSTVAGTRQVQAQVGTLAAAANVMLTAGAPEASRCDFVLAQRTAAGDGLDGLAVQVTARDAFGNPVPDAPVAFTSADANAFYVAAGDATATGTSSSSSVRLAQQIGTTDANGVLAAEWRTTSLGRLPLQVGVGAVQFAGSGNFVVGPVSVTRSSVVLPTTPVVADGVSLATVTVQLRDAAGHPVSGAPVDFLVPMGSGNVTFVGDANVTDASGALTVQFTSTSVGAVQVVARTEAGIIDPLASAGSAGSSGSGSGSGSSSGNANGTGTGNGNATTGGNTSSPNTVSVQAAVPFVPGSPVASNSSLTLSANALVADGQATTRLRLVVRDAVGHVVPQVAVALTSPAADVRFSPQTGSTDANGTLTAAVTGTHAGTALLVAALPATSLSTSLTLLPGSPNASASTLALSPTAVAADNLAQATATLQLRDAFGNAVPGQAVTLGLVDAGNATVPLAAAWLGATWATTDATGSLQTTVRGTRAGTYAVVASYGAQAQRANVRLLAGAANVVASLVTAMPQNGATADGNAAVQLQAIVRDGYGNPLPGQSVSWTDNAAGDVFAQASGITDANGTVQSVLRGTLAGARPVVAGVGGAGGIQVQVPVTLAAGPAAAGKSTLSVSPNAITADGNAQATVAVRARDAFNNPVPNLAVQLVAAGGDALTPASGTTDATGTWSAGWRATAAGNRTLTAQLGAPATASLQAVATFVAGPVDANASTVALAAAPLVAGAAPAQLTVTLRDARGNPVPQAALSLTSSAGPLMLSAITGTAGADGTWTGLVSATQAGPKRLDVAVGGTTLSLNFAVKPAAASATASSLVVAPTTLAAGTAAAATLTVRDAYGNAIAGANVTFAAQPNAAGALSAPSGSTAADGTATTTLRRTQAGSVALQATFGGATLSVPVTFVGAEPNAALSTFAASPNVGVADGASALTLTFVARDAYGNPVAGRGVVLSTDGSGDTLAARGGASVTGSDGSFVATLISQVAQAKTVTVTCGPVVQTAAVRFGPGPVDLSHSSFVGTPNDQVAADGNATSALALQAADAFGNPVANATFAVVAAQPWASVSAGHGALDGNGAWQASLDANGAWQGNVSAAMAGNVALSAIFGSRALGTTVRFVPAPPDAGLSSLSASPDQVQDDGVDRAQLVAYFVDVLGNPLAQLPVALAATGSDANFTVAAGATDDNGAFASALSATVAETKTVSATAGGLTVSTDVTFVAGQPTDQTLTLTASPNVVVARSGQVSTLTLLATDRSAQLLAGAAVSLAATAGNLVLANPSGTTDANGTFVTTATAGATGAAQITATVAGAHTSVQLLAQAGDAVAGQSTLSAVPASLTADGNSAASVVATLRDAYGNKVAGSHGLFAMDTGASASFAPLDGNSGTAGQLVSQATSTVAQAGNVTLHTAGGLTLRAPLAFRAGPPKAASSTLQATPSTSVANNLATTSVAAQILDAFGNPAASVPVTLTSSSSTATFGAQAAGQAYATTTDATGRFSVGLRDSVAGAQTLTLAVCGVQLATQVTFVPGPAAAAHSTLALSPAAAVADGNATVQATVVLRDAFANPLTGDAVAFALGGNGTYVATTNVATDATGTAATWLGSTVAEVKVLSATEAGSGLVLAANVTFNAGAPDLTASRWTGDAAVAVADNVGAITYTLVARDRYNNPIAALPVAASSTAAADTLSPAGGVTDAQGKFVSVQRSTLAGTKTVGVAFGGGSLQQNVTFLAGPATVGNTTLTAPLAAVPADKFSPLRITVTVADAYGNPVGGQNVTLASSDPADSLTQPSGVTDAAGQLSIDLRGQNAGVRTVIASFAGLSQRQNFVLAAGPPSNATSSLALTPNVVVADGSQTAQLVLLAKDAYGNPAVGQNVTLTSTGSGQVFASAAGTTDANGTFATTLTATVAQMKNVTATVGGISLGASARFVAGPPAAAQSTLTVAPPQTTADGNSSATLLASINDAYGNPCQNVTVAFGSANVADTFAPATAFTDASGTASTALRSTVSGARSVSAAAGGVTKNVGVTFVAGAPDAARSTFVASPNQITADGSSTSLLVVVAKDAQGNPVPMQAVSFVATGDGSATRLSGGGSTDANGRITAIYATTQAGVQHLTANLGATGLIADVAAVAGPASGQNSVFSASPSQLTADGNAAALLQITVQDAYANPVPNQSVSLSVTGGNNVLGAASGTTDATGVWRTSLRSTKAQAKTVTAQLGSAAVATQVTFLPGAASAQSVQLTFSPNAGIVADGNAATTVVLTVADAQGNPIAGQAANFTVSGGANVLGQNANGTDANGQLQVTLRSTKAETKTVTAQLGNVVVHGDVGFVAGPLAAAQSSFVASPNVIVADGNSTAQLSVRLADAFGNPVPGAGVTLYAGGGNNVVAPSNATTDVTGVVTGTLRSTSAESKTLTAAFAGGTLTAQVACVPGPVSNVASSFVATPSPTTADGASVATLTVQLADAQRNAIAGQLVQFVDNVVGDVFSASQATTGAQGQAQVTLSSTKSGLRTLTAQAQGTSFVASLRFAPGAPSAAGSQLTATPNAVVADNVSTARLALTAGDSFGNPVPGATVTWSADNGPNTFGAATSLTDDTGTATTTLTSPLAAAKTVTASLGATSLTVPVRFVAGPPNANQSSWVASVDHASADGNTPITLTLLLRDATANVVAGQNVTVSASGQRLTFTSATGPTDATGTWQTQLTSTKAQTSTVSAWVGGIVLPAQVQFVAAAPTNQSVALTASPNVQVADGTSTVQLTLSAADPYGNAVAGANVTFSASGPNATVAPAAQITNAGGLSQSAAQSTQVGAQTFLAAIGNVTASAGASFVAGQPNATRSSLGFSTDNVTADGNSTTTVSVAVRDALCHPIAGQTVLLGLSDASAQLANTTLLTDALGGASTQLGAVGAGVKQVTATFGAASVAGNVTFVAGPVSNNNSSFVATNDGGNAPVADGVATTTLRFVGRDAQQNPTAGHVVSFSSSDGASAPLMGNVLCDANGVATTTATTTVAGSRAFLAAVDGTSLAANTTFVAGEPNATTSGLSLAGTQATADNASPIGLSLVLRDAFGNPVVGRQVALSATGPGVSFSPSALTTGATGSATAVVTGTLAGPVTLLATAGAMQLGGNVTFVPGPAASATSTLALAPNALVAGASCSVQVVARDAQGNLSPNQTFALSTVPSNFTVSPNTVTTGPDGTAVATFTPIHVPVEQAVASLGGFALRANVAVTAAQPNAQLSQWSPAASTRFADNQNAATLVLVVRDNYGNPVPGAAAILSAGGSNVTLTPTGGVTDGNGTVTTLVTSSDVQTSQVTAQAAGLSYQANVTFVPGPASAPNSSLTATPVTLTAASGANVQLQVVVRDAQNRPMAGQAIGLQALSSSLDAIDRVQGFSDVSGQFSAKLTPAGTGSHKVTATAGGMALSAAVSVTAPTQPGCSGVPMLGGPAAVVTTGKQVQGLASGDVNGDGYADVVAVDANTSTLASYLGNGTGMLQTPMVQTVSLQQPTGVALADLNGDGVLDLLVADTGGNAIVAMLGQGDGSFASARQVATVTAPVKVVAADLNGDGRADLVASSNANAVVVALGAGDGNFAAATSQTLAGPGAGVVVGDFDADGKQDVAVATKNVGLSLLYGTGGGNLAAVVQLTGATTPLGLATANFNPDAYTDFAAADGSNGRLAVWRSSAARTYVRTLVTGLTAPGAVLAADFDGDGNVDVAALDGQTARYGRVSLFLGDGNGTFVANANYPALSYGSVPNQGSYPTLLPCDLNGDGLGDMVVASTGHLVTFLQTSKRTFLAASAVANSAPMALAADLNLDGAPDLVSTNGSGPTGNITISLNDGNGAFPSGQTLTGFFGTGASRPSVVAGDWSGDGLPDLLAYDQTNGVVALFANVGGGNLVFSRTFATCSKPSSGGLVDLNADGLLDLAFGCGSGYGLAVHRNAGNGNFLPANQALAGVSRSVVAFGDLNGDGIVDVVGSNVATNPETGSGIVAFSDGLGAFPNVVHLDGPTTGALAIADVNEDGLPDVLATEQMGSNVLLFANLGNANFASAAFVATAPNVQLAALALGDLRNSGHLDLVAGASALPEAFSGGVWTWPGRGDGTFGAERVYENSYAGTSVLAVADVNRDGLQDVVLGTTRATNSAVLFNAGCAVKVIGSPNATRSLAAADYSGGGGGGSAAVADTVAYAQLMATVLDAHKNPVANVPVTVSVSGGNATFAPASGTSDAQGHFSTAMRTSLAGSRAVTFTAGSGGNVAAFNANVAFVAGSPNLAASTLFASPNPQAIDQAAGVALSVLATDAYANPVAGVGVAWAATGNALTFAPTQVTSGANGRTPAVTLKSSAVGTVAVTATLSNAGTGMGKLNRMVSFVGGAASPNNTTLTASNPNAGVVWGNTNVTLALQAYDTAGNASAYRSVKLRSTRAFDRFTAQPVNTASTDANGLLQSQLWAAYAGPRTITATVDGQKRTASVTFATRPPFCATRTLMGTQPAVITPGPTVYNSGKTPGSRLADLDGDGKADLIVLSQGQNSLLTYQSRGDGTFAAPVSYALSCSPNTLVSTDFNGDDRPDFAVGCVDVNRVVILTNGGDGNLTSSVPTAFADRPAGLAAGDVTHDGLIDLVVYNPTSGLIAVYVNSGGSFVLGASQQVTNGISDAKVGNLNGDNYNDVFVASANGNSVSYLPSSGNGTLGAPIALYGALQPVGLAVGNVSGAGLVDVAVKAAGDVNDVVVTFNTSGAVVSTQPVFSGGVGSLRFVDWDGDGAVDLVGIMPNSAAYNAVGFARNDGSGHFPTATNLPIFAATSPASFSVGDVDGDGRTDLLISSANGVNHVQRKRSDGTLSAAKLVAKNITGFPLVSADFDNDGSLDLATAVNGNVAVAYGDNQGNFPRTFNLPAFSGGTPVATPNLARWIAKGDIDGDGWMDLVATSADSNYLGIMVWRNDGTGALSTMNFVPANVRLYAPAVADFDADGVLDLVVAENVSGGGNFLLYKGLGNGNFTYQRTFSTVGGLVNKLYAADFTGSGVPGLFVLRNGTAANSVWTNNGSGVFTTSTTFATMAASNGLVEDFDGDGKLDVVLIRTDQGAYFYRGNGDGTFAASVVTSFVSEYDGRVLYDAATGDFNGDGIVDIAATSYDSTTCTVLFGTGSGSFTLGGVYPTGGGLTRGVVAADFDGDGRMDLATAALYASDANGAIPGGIVLMMNQGCLAQ